MIKDLDIMIKEVSKLLIKNPDSNSIEGILNPVKNIAKFKKQFRNLLQISFPESVERWDVDERSLQGFIADGVWDLYYNFLCIGADTKSYGQPAFATQSNQGQTVGHTASILKGDY